MNRECEISDDGPAERIASLRAELAAAERRLIYDTIILGLYLGVVIGCALVLSGCGSMTTLDATCWDGELACEADPAPTLTQLAVVACIEGRWHVIEYCYELCREDGRGQAWCDSDNWEDMR